MSASLSTPLLDILRRRAATQSILDRYSAQSAEEALVKAAQNADLINITTLFKNTALNIHSTYNGLTAIQAAMLNTNYALRDPVVSYLLSKGANPINTTNNGQTALYSLKASEHPTTSSTSASAAAAMSASNTTNNSNLKREMYLAIYHSILNVINDPSIRQKSFEFIFTATQGTEEDQLCHSGSILVNNIDAETLEARLFSAYQDCETNYRDFLVLASSCTSRGQPITVKITLTLEEKEYAMDSLTDLSECIRTIQEEQAHSKRDHNSISRP